MTLVALWIRRNRNLHELVMAADSRIAGGESWDSCPKLMPLPRPATMIAMSGDAVEAYSFVIQAINTCSLLDGHLVGRTDIGSLAKSLKGAYGDSRRHVKDLPVGQTEPNVPTLEVILAGWSWRNLCFEAYSYFYSNRGVLQMNKLDLDVDRPFPLHMAGDAARDARRHLKILARERGLPLPIRGDPDAPDVARNAFYDWEPLEIITRAIADQSARSVGGVPQVLKAYQNGLTEAFVWRDADGRDHFGGRPVLGNERFDRRIMQLVVDRIVVSFSDKAVYAASSGEGGADDL